MLPKRVALEFYNVILDGKSYIKYGIVIDDQLTISVVMDVLDAGNGFSIDTELSIALVDSLADRYKIPEMYDTMNYYINDKKWVM